MRDEPPLVPRRRGTEFNTRLPTCIHSRNTFSLPHVPSISVVKKTHDRSLRLRAERAHRYKHAQGPRVGGHWAFSACYPKITARLCIRSASVLASRKTYIVATNWAIRGARWDGKLWFDIDPPLVEASTCPSFRNLNSALREAQRWLSQRACTLIPSKSKTRAEVLPETARETARVHGWRPGWPRVHGAASPHEKEDPGTERCIVIDHIFMLLPSRIALGIVAPGHGISSPSYAFWRSPSMQTHTYFCSSSRLVNQTELAMRELAKLPFPLPSP